MRGRTHNAITPGITRCRTLSTGSNLWVALAGDLATIRAVGHRPLEFELVPNHAVGVLLRARYSMGNVLLSRSGAEIRQSVSRRLKIQFEGAEANGPIAGEGTVESYDNYILGSDPARWRTRIPVRSKSARHPSTPPSTLFITPSGATQSTILSLRQEPIQRASGCDISGPSSRRVDRAASAMRCFCFISLGSLRSRRYFRAVFVSMPALDATTSNVDFPCATEV